MLDHVVPQILPSISVIVGFVHNMVPQTIPLISVTVGFADYMVPQIPPISVTAGFADVVVPQIPIILVTAGFADNMVPQIPIRCAYCIIHHTILCSSQVGCILNFKLIKPSTSIPMNCRNRLKVPIVDCGIAACVTTWLGLRVGMQYAYDI